jgi:hypothetical protein
VRYTDRADQFACQVFAMPTLLFIKDGKIRQRAEGAMLAPKIKDLAEHIFFDGVHPPPLLGVCRVFILKVAGPSLTVLNRRAPNWRLPRPPPRSPRPRIGHGRAYGAARGGGARHLCAPASNAPPFALLI